ncbi:hypothetical protein [Microlunatus parietis]|uniref:Uncharacterized protein n=1 Tax=Microlunatus parietis TaxID=682979 RepID=A0A7Y9I446_9ACTN|nr:hypothetical protein [Microlunatus parietis]NYE69822.1 hypothetical protein [Microlunatus parietis]
MILTAGRAGGDTHGVNLFGVVGRTGVGAPVGLRLPGAAGAWAEAFDEVVGVGGDQHGGGNAAGFR